MNLDTTSAQAQFQKAVALHQQGLLAQAQACYEAILTQYPQHFDTLHLSGVCAAQAGNASQGIQLMRRALDINSQHPICQYNYGNALSVQQQSEAALAAYNQAISIYPQYVEAYYSRGLILVGLKQYQLALEDYKTALSLRPDFAEVHLSCGNLWYALEQYEAAVASYDRAIHYKADFVSAFYNRGNALQACKQREAALMSYQAATRLKPDYVEAYFNQGVVLGELKRFADALACYEQALILQPDYAEAHCGRGLILQAQNQLQQALDCYSVAIQIRPDYAQAYSNRGTVLADMGKPQAALQDYQRALQLQPDNVETFSNQGSALFQLGDIDGALASYNQALAIDPQAPNAHWNRALMWLIKGEFALGWSEHEWRWQRETFTSPKRNFTQPLWLGETVISGKTLLLHTEQGMGDSLQFCRYVPFLKPLGAKLILEAERPLVTILNSLDGALTVLEKGQALPAFDYHCPLLSLPLACGTRSPEVVPADVPYLFASPSKIEVWHEKLGTKTKPRVGLVWNGGRHLNQPKLSSINARRDISFELIARLNRPDIDFYSLQKGEPAESELITTHARHWQGDNFHVLTQDIHDFSDTAAFIYHLDLVIAVDTSTAHLTGAMGKPVWLLNRFDSCWRWLLERDDSPWYPTMRLFRQPQAGDWDSVINAITNALEKWLKDQVITHGN